MAMSDIPFVLPGGTRKLVLESPLSFDIVNGTSVTFDTKIVEFFDQSDVDYSNVASSNNSRAIGGLISAILKFDAVSVPAPPNDSIQIQLLGYVDAARSILVTNYPSITFNSAPGRRSFNAASGFSPYILPINTKPDKPRFIFDGVLTNNTGSNIVVTKPAIYALIMTP